MLETTLAPLASALRCRRGMLATCSLRVSLLSLLALGLASHIMLEGCSAPAPAGIAAGEDGGAGAGSDSGAPGETGSPGSSGGGSDAGAHDASSLSTPDACPPSWTTTPACGGGSNPAGSPPDFGPNVLIFDPSMPMATIQTKIDDVYGQTQTAEFGSGRYAFFFKPGQYSLDVRIGFYTQLIGLGHSPDDVMITGAVRSKADYLPNNNATCTFWKGAENFAVVPTQAIDSAVNVWAVSQGTSLRRAHVMGSIRLDDGGWSSGGFIADSKIDTQIRSGTQQQFLTRNVDLTDWQGQNWNMVFVGDGQPPAGTWPDPPYSVTPKTPTIREKPFLFVDASGSYFVMVPALKKNSQGPSWGTGAPPGSAVSIDQFHVAKAGTDNASTLNAALAAGKHLLFTPGIYHLGAAVQVSRPGTIVLGLGLATLIADSGNAVLSIADVDAVTLGGVILEAGPTSSPVLLDVGPAGSSKAHAQAPTVLFDVHCRVGGGDVGTADNCVTIHSNDVIVDNTWLWRADHGAGADWYTNKSKNGLIVNGADVTIYGLFAEHFQEYQALWNGNGGAVFFYQSEMPYDPPSQNDWQAAPGKKGYPSYKVADTVTTHQATGIGVYSVFSNNVQADNAIESPTNAGVVLRHMITVSLGGGSINNIVNGTGGTVGQGGSTVQKTSY